MIRRAAVPAAAAPSAAVASPEPSEEPEPEAEVDHDAEEQRSEPATSAPSAARGMQTIEATGADLRRICPSCGRRFNPASFERHQRVCQQVFRTTRPPFDPMKGSAVVSKVAPAARTMPAVRSNSSGPQIGTQPGTSSSSALGAATATTGSTGSTACESGIDGDSYVAAPAAPGPLVAAAPSRALVPEAVAAAFVGTVVPPPMPLPRMTSGSDRLRPSPPGAVGQPAATAPGVLSAPAGGGEVAVAAPMPAVVSAPATATAIPARLASYVVVLPNGSGIRSASPSAVPAAPLPVGVGPALWALEADAAPVAAPVATATPRATAAAPALAAPVAAPAAPAKAVAAPPVLVPVMGEGGAAAQPAQPPLAAVTAATAAAEEAASADAGSSSGQAKSLEEQELRVMHILQQQMEELREMRRRCSQVTSQGSGICAADGADQDQHQQQEPTEADDVGLELPPTAESDVAAAAEAVPPEEGALRTCDDCGRRFNPASFEKHRQVCRSVFGKSSRTPFESQTQRLRSLPVPSREREVYSGSGTPPKPSSFEGLSRSPSSGVEAPHLVSRDLSSSPAGTRCTASASAFLAAVGAPPPLPGTADGPATAALAPATGPRLSSVVGGGASRKLSTRSARSSAGSATVPLGGSGGSSGAVEGGSAASGAAPGSASPPATSKATSLTGPAHEDSSPAGAGGASGGSPGAVAPGSGATRLTSPVRPLQPCPFCGRSFRQAAFEKHTRVCQSVFPSRDSRDRSDQQRQVYDSRRHRLKGTPFEAYVASVSPSRDRTSSSTPPRPGRSSGAPPPSEAPLHHGRGSSRSPKAQLRRSISEVVYTPSRSRSPPAPIASRLHTAAEGTTAPVWRNVSSASIEGSANHELHQEQQHHSQSSTGAAHHHREDVGHSGPGNMIFGGMATKAKGHQRKDGSEGVAGPQPPPQPQPMPEQQPGEGGDKGGKAAAAPPQEPLWDLPVPSTAEDAAAMAEFAEERRGRLERARFGMKLGQRPEFTAQLLAGSFSVSSSERYLDGPERVAAAAAAAEAAVAACDAATAGSSQRTPSSRRRQLLGPPPVVRRPSPPPTTRPAGFHQADYGGQREVGTSQVERLSTQPAEVMRPPPSEEEAQEIPSAIIDLLSRSQPMLRIPGVDARRSRGCGNSAAPPPQQSPPQLQALAPATSAPPTVVSPDVAIARDGPAPSGSTSKASTASTSATGTAAGTAAPGGAHLVLAGSRHGPDLRSSIFAGQHTERVAGLAGSGADRRGRSVEDFCSHYERCLEHLHSIGRSTTERHADGATAPTVAIAPGSFSVFAGSGTQPGLAAEGGWGGIRATGSLRGSIGVQNRGITPHRRSTRRAAVAPAGGSPPVVAAGGGSFTGAAPPPGAGATSGAVGAAPACARQPPSPAHSHHLGDSFVAAAAIPVVGNPSLPLLSAQPTPSAPLVPHTTLRCDSMRELSCTSGSSAGFGGRTVYVPLLDLTKVQDRQRSSLQLHGQRHQHHQPAVQSQKLPV